MAGGSVCPSLKEPSKKMHGSPNSIWITLILCFLDWPSQKQFIHHQKEGDVIVSPSGCDTSQVFPGPLSRNAIHSEPSFTKLCIGGEPSGQRTFHNLLCSLSGKLRKTNQHLAGIEDNFQDV